MGMQVPDNLAILPKVECKILITLEDLKTSLPSINALHALNPSDHLDMSDRLTLLNLQLEQQKDTNNNKLVLAWIANGSTSPSPYMNTELRKYLKHFARLENHNGLLYRKLYSDNGRDFIRQYVVPTHSYVRKFFTEYTTANMPVTQELRKWQNFSENTFISRILKNFRSTL